MVDLDIDLWGYGRDPNGCMSDQYLRASYPHVDHTAKVTEGTIWAMLDEHFERNHYDQRVYLVRLGFVCFQNRDDAHFYRALLFTL